MEGETSDSVVTSHKNTQAYLACIYALIAAALPW